MTFDHILFPIDFSEHSLVVKAEVEVLARRYGSKVTLMHVFEIPASWCMAGEATFTGTCLSELMMSAKERLLDYPILLPPARVERVMSEGSPPWHIADWANSHDCDLIMMGSHGWGKLQGVLIGSVTAKVMHDVACPVWTDSSVRLRDSSLEPIRTILCALEINNESVPLLSFVAGLAADLNASVRVVHSVPEIQTRPCKYFDFDLHRYLMESALVEISKLQREAATAFPVSVEGTDICDAVRHAANTWGADLVVIGRGRAHSALGQFRTHTYELIRRAPCPVLSYWAPEPAHISSSCSVGHHDQYAANGQLLTGCQPS